MAGTAGLIEGPYLNIRVFDWIRMPSKNGDIISYGIETVALHDRHFKGPTSLTRHPYSDFDELRELLVSRHGDVQVPNIPPRVPPEDESSEAVIQIRMTGFQQFIDQVLAIEELRSDPCLPLFIQTIKSMAEIREEVQSNAQQEDLNPNNQAEEGDNPEAEDPIADDPDADQHMDNRGPVGYIFDMDDFD